MGSSTQAGTGGTELQCGRLPDTDLTIRYQTYVVFQVLLTISSPHLFLELGQLLSYCKILISKVQRATFWS